MSKGKAKSQGARTLDNVRLILWISILSLVVSMVSLGLQLTNANENQADFSAQPKPQVELLSSIMYSEDGKLKAFKYDAERHKLSIHLKDSQRETGTSFADFLTQNKALMLTNGGIFTKQYSPLGLYIAKGRQITPLNTRTGHGNFYLAPNGVFMFSGRSFVIQTTAEYQQNQPSPEFAIQSGPMLITKGRINRQFNPQSSHTFSRNAVCLTDSGQLYFFYQASEVSLYNFSAKLKKEFGCYNGLYLDGAISGMYTPGDTLPGNRKYATIIAVTDAGKE